VFYKLCTGYILHCVWVYLALCLGISCTSLGLSCSAFGYILHCVSVYLALCLGIPCTVFVLICTVVVLYCFVMCVCVFYLMCGCFSNMYTAF
jgi:uncharacterized membrane protein